MNNLIGILFAIILGAIAVVLTIVYFGSGYADQSVSAKAQRTVNTSAEIELALMAYKAENGVIHLSDPASGLPSLQPIIDAKLLKQDVNNAQLASELEWKYDETSESVQKLLGSDAEGDGAENECREINRLRHDTPITDPIPDCATNTLKLSCCSVSN